MDKTDSGRPDDVIEKRETSARKTRPSAASSSRGRKRRRAKADPGRYLIARLLGLVCLVLVVFEGNVIYRLFSHQVGTSVEIMNTGKKPETEGLLQDSAASDTVKATKEASPTTGGNATVTTLAGGIIEDEDIPAKQQPETAIAPAPQEMQSSEQIDSDKVVPLRDTPVDDSFFSNAVFIGDSRMEGFRNSSGITDGTFLTGVGLAINDMDRQIISTAEGNISVYQGLSGHQYGKIYLMLGANDLGYYPWEDFLPQFESVLKQFHELQPKAIIYVCSVIYVDESKIAPGFEYDNNDNVRTINGYILQACEDLWYSYYMNLNEIFSNGAGGLIYEASSDGIHLYPDYLAMMHDYLRTHYYTDEEFAEEISKHPDDIANAQFETEKEASSGGGGDGLITDDDANMLT